MGEKTEDKSSKQFGYRFKYKTKYCCDTCEDDVNKWVNEHGKYEKSYKYRVTFPEFACTPLWDVVPIPLCFS